MRKRALFVVSDEDVRQRSGAVDVHVFTAVGFRAERSRRQVALVHLGVVDVGDVDPFGRVARLVGIGVPRAVGVAEGGVREAVFVADVRYAEDVLASFL